MAPDQTPDEPSRAPVHRRPQLSRFLVAGAVLGLVVGVVVSLSRPDAPGSSSGQQAILLGATGAIFFGLLAAIVYLVVDRGSGRR
ncbi:hypothetical protein SGUI_2521 [Serinicoccus hydrothermalis]|uniref:Uncharacterized protein n=1 Tax=Serinicoccus hydrothermalis TaxID=1758689 RepID=A0A1B1NEQ1_9MICO|nr:hypothetical protein [Serinicoccus hydrothermalis]ANS79917.1 hypothetical protein SGUI_2521 [Serinicoccus hydrothermalis]